MIGSLIFSDSRTDAYQHDVSPSDTHTHTHCHILTVRGMMIGCQENMTPFWPAGLEVVA